jgi:two-component system chemotaxis sensor kinase CheA
MNQPSQFAAAFLQEATEQLALVEDITLELETRPDDVEALNRLFRIFHTIKGSGSMFGFDAVAGFTHHVETVLDLVRSGKVRMTRELVDVILASEDHIRLLLGGDPLPAAGAEAALIARLNAMLPAANGPAEPPPQKMPVSVAAVPPDASGEPIARYHIHFQPEPSIYARGIDPLTLLQDLRKLGTCDIHASTSGVTPLEQFTPDSCGFSWDITLATDQGINAIKDVFIFVEEESKITIESLPPAPAPIVTDAVAPQNAPASASAPAPATLPTPEPPVIEQPTPSSENVPSPDAAAKPSITPARKAEGFHESVRVPAHRLDSLVNLVGELVINQSRLAQVAGRLNEPSLSAPAEDLERLVNELRDIVLGIRMMPIGGTFNRFKRLVRDLSAELEKEVDLITVGEETELDKTVIDHLGDPLVHLIRNAIDHGINIPEERLRQGKPRRGTVRLSARYEGANVIIAIEDDGQGLNRDAIRAKAIEKNLIPADKVLAENELFNLIFLPGFSTAPVITSVSGRGVGMDVVKRQIDSLRGTVEITSQQGQGTRVALTLPLTLAIIDGLLVEVNQEQFIIPMSSVRENVELSQAQRQASNGRNLLAVRGELVSYLRLRDLFAITGGEQELERVVIVNAMGSRIGLVVDRVIGSRQTVIQSLGRFYRNIEVFSGATIMGDGRVALILDLPGILRYNGDRAY